MNELIIQQKYFKMFWFKDNVLTKHFPTCDIVSRTILTSSHLTPCCFCEIAFKIQFVLYIQIIKIIYDHLRSSAVAQITHYFEFIIITQYYISKMSGL